MESRRPSEPTPSETREARGRSRSPHNSDPQPKAPLGGRRRRGSVDDRSPSEVKRSRQERATWTSNFLAESAAEDARRRALSSDEPLQEDGDQLRQEIEADPEIVVALEVSSSHRARCRANDDCVYSQANAPRGNTITTYFRIYMYGVENTEWFGRTKHYYHVMCFAFMIDLVDLLPEKFKLDGASGRWGLMLEKWFEHSGRIDLDKIATFLEKFDEFEAKHGEYNEWCWAHAEHCEDEEAECRCPPRPDPPSKPELGDFIKEDGDVCTLLDVLKHRFAMKRIAEWWIE
ncbi:hypothetical protein C8A05DRAFT_19419 [Staphylotrichum tortipilum]|uniref:Uncharacterized protein n=1 Tax=Staphylotrichum tortipilum TaxID=2831512 RepID=A0AAN6MCG6_9PEZI|nr:hypothetical protein C8A05DRAFT_19419 [Staphylotrichum longicolle]